MMSNYSAPWTVGKEYIYGMHSLAITDIPDLASQAAGIKFDAELMIQCPCDSSILVKVSLLVICYSHWVMVICGGCLER